MTVDEKKAIANALLLLRDVTAGAKKTDEEMRPVIGAYLRVFEMASADPVLVMRAIAHLATTADFFPPASDILEIAKHGPLTLEDRARIAVGVAMQTLGRSGTRYMAYADPILNAAIRIYGPDRLAATLRDGSVTDLSVAQSQLVRDYIAAAHGIEAGEVEPARSLVDDAKPSKVIEIFKNGNNIKQIEGESNGCL